MANSWTSPRGTRVGAAVLAYRQLRDMIVSGDLAPGCMIAETEIAAQLGISRTPLREALKRLETERFVYRLSTGRTRVTELSIKEAQDLFAVRMAMECLVIERAACTVTDTWAVKLRDLKRSLEVSAEAGLTQEFARLGGEFHSSLVMMAENSFAAWVLAQLDSHIKRYRSIGPNRKPERRLQAAQEHIKMLELVLARDPQEASAIMRQHIEHSTLALLQSLENTMPGDAGKAS